MYVCTPIPSPNHHKEVSQCSQCTGTVKQTNQTHGQQCAVRCHTVGQKSKFCPKCSSNPIEVIPIWKWKFTNGAVSYYIHGALQPENKSSKINLLMKDYKWCRKRMVINQVSCNKGYLQIPLQSLPLANGARPHYHCKAFWAQCRECHFIVPLRTQS